MTKLRASPARRGWNERPRGVDLPFTSFAGSRGLLVNLQPQALMFGCLLGRTALLRAYTCALAAIAAALSTPANATPNCLKDHGPFKLAGDSIEYSMSIAPGADCIQGLRFATMQIYSVRILEKPTSGELVMVGTGFRYFAKPDFSGTDKFSLTVVGKNLREEGSSTVEITVSPLNVRPKENLVSQLDAAAVPAEAAH
jgi:hypothetical protein